MPNTLNTTRREIEDRLIGKAQLAKGFRQKLLENPRQAIADEVGIKVPEGVTFTVLEETPNQMYLVLPKVPAEAHPGLGPTGVVRLLTEVAGPVY